MEFSLTEDQALLRDSADRFLTKEYDFATRTRIVNEGSFSAHVWSKFAELGWLGACLPVEAGGYGGAVEAMVLMEAFGRHLLVEPFISTVIVGGQLLGALDEARRAPLVERLIAGHLQLALATTERYSGFDLAKIETSATRSGSGWTINGVKPLVPNGGRADKIFVTARTGATTAREDVTLFMVDRDAPGITVRDYRTHDGAAASEIVFDAALVETTAMVGTPGAGLAIVETASDHGIAALCAESVGSAAHVLAATIAYLKTREQYGAPLARLQVLQHRMAEMYVAVEQARAMATLAAHSLHLPADQRARQISAAKVAVTGYARMVTQQAVQLHGGMGVSEELDIAHHLKRLTVSAMTFGDETHHLARFIALDDAAAA